MTTLEALIGVIAIALMTGVFVLAGLARRVGKAADDVALAARRVEELTPVARAQLEAMRSLTDATTGVVENVRTVSGQVSAVTSQLLRGVESEVVERYRAAFAGIRAGADVLGWVRNGNRSHASEHAEAEEFEHMRD